MPDSDSDRPPSPSKRPDRRKAALIGFVAGLLNGLIALGGGIIITPLLVVNRGASPQVAVGTSLATVVILSLCSLVVHASVSGLIIGPLPMAITVVAGFLGSLVGGRVLAGLTPRSMLLIFSVFVLLVSLKLVVQGLGFHFGGAASAESQPVPVFAYVALGAFSGVMSGIFGVGGGALVLLGLAAFFNTPVQEGLPIALAINVTNALWGAWSHARAGRVLWTEVHTLIPTAIAGIGVGVLGALWLPPDAMRVIFGVFFIFMGVRFARQGLKQPRK